MRRHCKIGVSTEKRANFETQKWLSVPKWLFEVTGTGCFEKSVNAVQSINALFMNLKKNVTKFFFFAKNGEKKVHKQNFRKNAKKTQKTKNLKLRIFLP